MKLKNVVILTILTLLAGCGDHHHHEEGVSWPALAKLDEEAERIEVQIKHSKLEQTPEASEALFAAFEAFVKSEIPADVKNKALVEQHILALKTLERMKSPQQLEAFARSTHALVVEIMEAAGMPHVHKDDHHHHDHDHDHDHHHDH